MNTNILVPFIKLEESSKFYLNGRTFEVLENEIRETETVEPQLQRAIAAFESFDFTTSAVKWYHGPSKFIYSLEEGTFKQGDILIEGNTFSNHVLAAGSVRYSEKPIAELFESIPNLLENFIVLDFAASFKGNNITVDLFKINEDVYVSRFNSTTRIAKFYKASSANSALESVLTDTGLDATKFLSDLLEGEAKENAQRLDLIEQYEDMISFWKDQRGLLAEADKTIEEIKAADVLINDEILAWETKIADLKA